MRKYFLFIFFTFSIWSRISEATMMEGATIGDDKQSDAKYAVRSVFLKTDRLDLLVLNRVLILSYPSAMAIKGANGNIKQ